MGNVFETLNALNVNEHIEKKKQGGTQLSYLSWTWAWSSVKKLYPDADYTIWKDPVTHLPYIFDPNTGYMVFTSVTIDGQTHEMWLAVMDGANNAMKSIPYEYKTSTGKTVSVKAATMTDINKSIMRCLTKNLAMFGLGLYIYAGEDLPEGDEPEPTPWVKFETCEECGNRIKDHQFAKGSKSADWVMQYSYVHFKKKLCGACLEKAMANANN